MFKIFRVTALCGLLVLGACGGNSPFNDLIGAAEQDSEKVESCLTRAKNELGKPDDVEATLDKVDAPGFTDFTITYINHFLDCAVGPANDNEARLLRGHAIVSVISRYAAYNAGARVPGLPNLNLEAYDNLEDDVAATLMSIEDAEFRLRRASSVVATVGRSYLDRPPYLVGMARMYPTITAEYDEIQQIKRVLSVLRVFKNAATPTYKRAQRTFFRFIAAVGGSLPSARLALRDAAKGIGKYVVFHKFGRAYREEVEIHLKAIAQSGQPPSQADWDKWDKPLVDACDNMARYIDGRHHCIPGT